VVRPNSHFRDSGLGHREPDLSERMAKKDFRWFLAFMAVVLSGLAFAVIGNV
jgi:hypothetical protein